MGRAARNSCTSLNHGVEPGCPLTVIRIFSQQVAVLLHANAASGRGHDDCVHSGAEKRLDVTAGQPASLFQIAPRGCESHRSTPGRSE